MLPRDVLTLATLMLTGFAVAVTNGAPADLDAEDYDETTRPVDKGNARACLFLFGANARRARTYFRKRRLFALVLALRKSERERD